MKLINWLLSLSLLCVLPAYASTIRVNVDFDDHHATSFQLIKAALDMTRQDYGPYTFQRVKSISQGRAEHELVRGKHIDMLWFATSRQREEKLLPIRIPLDDGLLGHRVCMVKADSAVNFKNVQNVSDFLRLNIRVGSGDHWPDTDILKANQIPTVTSPFYESLFQMLAQERFDCFLRSVLEIQNEIKRPGNEGLSIEPSLLVKYPMPTFIFVNKKNTALAERIATGFRRIMKNGEFKKISKRRRDTLASLHLENRRVITLYNPSLSNETREFLESISNR